MILVDANLLVYAVVPGFAEHERARPWLEEQMSSDRRTGLPWSSLLAFVRLVSNPRVVSRPVAVATAWGVAREWLDLPGVWIPAPTDRHADVLEPLLSAVTRSDLVPDAHLAALAIEHGLTLCSNDGDFARFGGLAWRNPLGD
jgi:toxin-antitoxin system PIN domain toxin